MARLPDGVSYYREDFIIDSRKQVEIDEAMALARRNWRRFDELDATYPPDHTALLDFSEQVTLPFGYRLAISVQEWPAKRKWYQRSPSYDRRYHLVLSIDDKPGTVPPPPAFAKVLRACRHNDDPPDKVWVQDYECYGGAMGYEVHALWPDASQPAGQRTDMDALKQVARENTARRREELERTPRIDRAQIARSAAQFTIGGAGSIYNESRRDDFCDVVLGALKTGRLSDQDSTQAVYLREWVVTGGDKRTSFPEWLMNEGLERKTFLDRQWLSSGEKRTSFEEWYTQRWITRGDGPSTPSQPTKSEAQPVAQPRPAEAPLPNVATFVAEGDTFLEQQKLEAAITSYGKAIKAEPNNATLFFKRGVAWSNKYYNQGKNIADLRASVSDYSRAIELNPQFGEAVFQRAGLWSEWGMADKAAADYGRCIQLDVHPADSYFCRGVLWQELKKFDQAIDDLTKAIELGDEYALFARGQTYREAGKIKSALTDFTEALSTNSDAPGICHERAKTYEDAGRFEEAIADYSRCIEKSFMENGDAYAERGHCYMRTKRGEMALNDFEHAARLRYDFSLLQTRLRSEGTYDGPIDGRLNSALKGSIRRC